MFRYDREGLEEDDGRRACKKWKHKRTAFDCTESGTRLNKAKCKIIIKSRVTEKEKDKELKEAERFWRWFLGWYDSENYGRRYNCQWEIGKISEMARITTYKESIVLQIRTLESNLLSVV